VLRDLVRVILVALKDHRLLAALRFSDEFLECIALEEDLATPGTLFHRLRDRKWRGTHWVEIFLIQVAMATPDRSLLFAPAVVLGRAII